MAGGKITAIILTATVLLGASGFALFGAKLLGFLLGIAVLIVLLVCATCVIIAASMVRRARERDEMAEAFGDVVQVGEGR